MRVFKASIKEWERMVDGCSWATFFHTPTWAKVVEETFGYKAEALLFEFGAQRVLLPANILPVFRGGAKAYISMFAGTYGGPLSEKEVSEELIEKIFSYMRRKRRVLSFHMFCSPFCCRQPKGEELFTQVVPLQGGYKRVYENIYHKECRKNIRKATSRGVLIQKATSFSELQEYYSIYQKALEKWAEDAKSSYPFKLFECIWKECKDNMQLFLAKSEGRIIAGTIIFYYRNWAGCWHGVGLYEFYNLYPNNLLHDAAIKDAIQRGCIYYDMGASHGLEGVIRFKDSFGTERKSFSHIYWEHPLYKIASFIKR